MLVDVGGAEDAAAVNALQDQLPVETGSTGPFVAPDDDEESFEAVRQAVLQVGRAVPDGVRMFGKKDQLDPIRYFLGTAGGWGRRPENGAFFRYVDVGLNVGDYAVEVPADVPMDAFWSVSLYNASGFFEPNDRKAYSINLITGRRNRMTA